VYLRASSGGDEFADVVSAHSAAWENVNATVGATYQAANQLAALIRRGPLPLVRMGEYEFDELVGARTLEQGKLGSGERHSGFFRGVLTANEKRRSVAPASRDSATTNYILSLRRTKPAKPITPEPSNIRLLGSGIDVSA